MNLTVWLLAVLIAAGSAVSPAMRADLRIPARVPVNAGAAGFQLENAEDGRPVSLPVAFSTAALSAGGAILTTMSVSPSGQYIAAVDRSHLSTENRFAAGVANPFGRLPEAIYLFIRSGGQYTLWRTVPVDPQAQPELSSMLGGGCEMVWNEDETRAVIAAKWGAGSETMSYIMTTHSNLYLFDLNDGSLRRLTDSAETYDHRVLPAWSGDHTVRYLRTSLVGGDVRNVLREIDTAAGRDTRVADLYSAGGAVSVVYQWQTAGQSIYYILESLRGDSGFYMSPVGGLELQARCLVSIRADLRETNRQPYCSVFAQMALSADGRWACLTVSDRRVYNRDIPYADSADRPQADPAKAYSRDGRPWVPCHDVFLVDLTRGRLADPFTDPRLSPTKTIVTGACFAPDGQSLLCAVFGDGGPWCIADNTRATFYQIDLADGRFPARRVFEAELYSSLLFPEGLRWSAAHDLWIPTGQPPAHPVQRLSLTSLLAP